MFEKIYPYFAITVGILILGVIGKIEYEDEKAAQANIAQMCFRKRYLITSTFTIMNAL